MDVDFHFWLSTAALSLCDCDFEDLGVASAEAAQFVRAPSISGWSASISASSQAILWSLNCIGAGELADLYQSSHMIATVGDPLLGTELGESDESHAVSSEAKRFCTV